MSRTWKSYEEVALYLIDTCAGEFGLTRVEGKQKVRGHRSGTEWEIDAKGVREGNEGFVIIECRRYTKSKQRQESLGALAYRILDTGASSGIIVSPLGLQEGAQKIAQTENIIDVQLDQNCTPQEFSMRFLNKLMIGMREEIGIGDSFSADVIRTCSSCGQQFQPAQNEKNLSKLFLLKGGCHIA